MGNFDPRFAPPRDAPPRGVPPVLRTCLNYVLISAARIVTNLTVMRCLHVTATIDADPQSRPHVDEQRNGVDPLCPLTLDAPLGLEVLPFDPLFRLGYFDRGVELTSALEHRHLARDKSHSRRTSHFDPLYSLTHDDQLGLKVPSFDSP